MIMECKSPKWYKALDIEFLLKEFKTIYNNRPIKNNDGGMLSTHMFYVWLTAKAVKPKLIVDSGTYKGQSAWLLKQACPNSKIISFDPSKDSREVSCEGVDYISSDFSEYDWSELPDENLILFDDHQNAYTRLQQCKWFGFKNIIFEDNYPITQGDCYSLKKIISGSGFRPELFIQGSKLQKYLKLIINTLYKKITRSPEQMVQFQSIAVKPNEHDKFFLDKNLDIYFEFPPLYQPPTTRWGDSWTEEIYPTPTPIFGKISEEEVNSSNDFYKNECKNYTWICYVNIKN